MTLAGTVTIEAQRGVAPSIDLYVYDIWRKVYKSRRQRTGCGTMFYVVDWSVKKVEREHEEQAQR